MATEISELHLSFKDESIINIFGADTAKFARGLQSSSLKTGRGGPRMGEGLLARASHVIADERQRFPDVADVQGRDFEIGVVIGEWIHFRNVQAEMERDPEFKQRVLEAQGLTELPD